MPQHRVVGIIGGMGPEATADLFFKIVQETNANTDQEHLEVVVVSDPTVPDRTKAILENTADPLPKMVNTAQRCVQGGADFLIMPCNTAHHFYKRLTEQVDVPVLHMMDEVAFFLSQHHKPIQKVGLMATDGTIKSELYQAALRQQEIEVLSPDPHEQTMVMEAIYGEDGVKAGCIDQPQSAFKTVADALIFSGAKAIIAGCTEIPLALSSEDVENVLFVDSTRVLASAAVKFATGQLDRRF